MKLEKARITFLVGAESTTIELIDAKSSITFAEIKLTPEQLSSALSRMAYTQCEISLHGLDRLNKELENKTFKFEISEELYKYNNRNIDDLNKVCLKALEDQGMSDWKPDDYYGSQGSFKEENGKKYACVTIRRWI